MKKILLIIASIAMVMSGVAAVSAYEAHVVNVKATVENALFVDATELDFGVVFPEEWLNRHFDVTFSTSWSDQSRVNSVDFEVWAEDKVDPNDGFYPWLGDVLYVQMNGQQGYIGAAIAGPLHAQPALDGAGAPIVGTLNPGNPTQTVNLYIDVPVYPEYYNPLTDVPDKPRPEWADLLSNTPIDEPTHILPLGTPQHYTMGVDIKIQVVDIYFVAQ